MIPASGTFTLLISVGCPSDGEHRGRWSSPRPPQPESGIVTLSPVVQSADVAERHDSGRSAVVSLLGDRSPAVLNHLEHRWIVPDLLGTLVSLLVPAGNHPHHSVVISGQPSVRGRSTSEALRASWCSTIRPSRPKSSQFGLRVRLSQLGGGPARSDSAATKSRRQATEGCFLGADKPAKMRSRPSGCRRVKSVASDRHPRAIPARHRRTGGDRGCQRRPRNMAQPGDFQKLADQRLSQNSALRPLGVKRSRVQIPAARLKEQVREYEVRKSSTSAECRGFPSSVPSTALRPRGAHSVQVAKDEDRRTGWSWRLTSWIGPRERNGNSGSSPSGVLSSPSVISRGRPALRAPLSPGGRGAWDRGRGRVPQTGLPGSLCGPVAVTRPVTTQSPDGRLRRPKFALRTPCDTDAAQPSAAARGGWSLHAETRRNRGYPGNSRSVRGRTGPFASPIGSPTSPLMSRRAKRARSGGGGRMRKVHHPKIVQRSDRRWMVACDDCARERGLARPVGIHDPVDSFEAAERIWEGHVERRIPRMRRTA